MISMQELLNTGVNFTLEYDEKENAMIGQVKGYSAAVRENLATASYGCLLWVKRGIAAGERAEDYLEAMKLSQPEYLKNYRVAANGIAIALNRSGDSYKNITGLKRFLYDFADFLSQNGYVNCCCECGAEYDLGIYQTGQVITQVCSGCGEKYTIIMKVNSSAPKMSEPSAPIFAEPAEEFSLDDYAEELRRKAEIAEKSEPDAELHETDIEKNYDAPAAREDGISSLLTEIAPTEPQSNAFSADIGGLNKNEINRTDEVSLSELMFDENEKPAEETPAPQKNVSIDSLLFTEQKSAPEPETQKPEEDYDCTPLSERGDMEFESLLAGNSEEKKPEPPKSEIFEAAEREYAAEQAKMQKTEPEKFDINELLLNENGEIELQEVKPEVDDGTVVTEIRDDSNDGEKIDVEEIKSLVNAPTVTTGHPQLSAEETPLEADGSVPLVNPNANREEKRVSPVDGPDAVTPLAANYAPPTALYEEEKPRTLPPGFADSSNMIDRDEPVRYGAPAPYEPNSSYSSYVHTIDRGTQGSNAIMGIIGALTCGMIGVAIWVAIAMGLNIISWWGGIALTATTFGGYYLAGRALDKKGIVISAVITIVMMLIGVAAMSAIDVRDTFTATAGTDISLFDALHWITYLMSLEPSIKSAFIKNLGFSFLVTLIADISVASTFWRKAD